MQFYNVHSHIFTMNNAPKKFLHLYLPGWVADAIDTITNTKVGARSVEWALSHIPWSPGKRYASFLRIGKSKNQLEVFEDLIQQYDDETMKFVALTLYMEKCGASTSASGFEGQLEEILMVKKQYPDRLLIFLGIDPRWKFNGAELRKTVEGYFEQQVEVNATRRVYPFTGLKLYPSTGFYGFDERLKETFEWAADNGVPVLTHCNYLGGIYNNDADFIEGNLNPYDPYSKRVYSAPVYQNKKTRKKLFGNTIAGNNQNSCSYFLEPESFRSMLTCFTPKKLKLCLAHYGGAEHIRAQHGKLKVDESRLFGVKKQNWCGQIQQLMKDFPSVYTDISYAVAKEEIHNLVFEDLDNPDYMDKIMFGTDFFLTERESPEKQNYSTFKKNARQRLLQGGDTAWSKIAGSNVEQFLKSKYYP